MRTVRFAVFLVCLALAGCVMPPQGPSQYQIQADNLRYAYESGRITADQDYARLHELQALEQQDRAQRQQAALMIMGNMQQNAYQQQQLLQQEQRQRQQMLQQIYQNRPQHRTGSGTIWGPNMEMYRYNWNEY